MRHLLIALFVLVSIATSAKEQPVITTISAVKVFLSGAEVTRTGKADLPKGTATLVFAGLSEEVDPSNIQVSGSGAFTILGVQHRLNYLEQQQDRAEVTVFKDRIATLEADIERENSLLAVVEKEDARLSKNEVVAGEQGLTLAQLQSINEYLRGRQESIAIKRIAIRHTITTLNEELGKVKLQLAQIQGKKTRPNSEVVVEVSANAAVSATLTLKYMVQSAGWSPTYDIRVADITKPMELTYKAQVYQSTGEDWDKVQLALSSGEPNRDAIMPTLYPWRLDFGTPRQAPVANVQPGFNPNVRDVRGIIRDASTGEPLPFVNVILSDVNGQTIIDTVYINEHPDPEYTVLSSIDSLWTTGGTAWQWFFNGTTLVSDTASSIAEATGDYHALVTDAYGCIWSTDTVTIVLNTSVADVESRSLRVYPVPAALVLFVDHTGGGVRAELLNSSGQRVRNVGLQAGRNVLDVASLPSGIYLLHTTDGSTSRFLKE